MIGVALTHQEIEDILDRGPLTPSLIARLRAAFLAIPCPNTGQHRLICGTCGQHGACNAVAGDECVYCLQPAMRGHS